MKILCLCAGGNTRSVTFATLLKYYWKHDALAASVEKNHPETLSMLARWSDEIIVAAPDILEEFLDKVDVSTGVRLLDLGQDKWGMSMHPELVPLAYKLLEATYGSAPRRKTIEQIIGNGGKYEARRTGAGAASSRPLEEIAGEGANGGGDR